jgi:hypothetical protein
MPDYRADAAVSVDNLDSLDEADDIEALIESALRGAGYYATVTVTAYDTETAGA